MITVQFDDPDIAAGRLDDKGLMMKSIAERTLAAKVEELDCSTHGDGRWLTITVYGGFDDLSCDVKGCCDDFVAKAEAALES